MTVPKSNPSRTGTAWGPADVDATPTAPALFFSDLQGNVTGCDQRFSQLLGWMPDELRGKTLSVFFSANGVAEANHDPLETTIIATASAHGPYQSDVCAHTKSGKTVDAQLRVSLLRGHTAVPMGMVGVLTNTSNSADAGKSLATA